MSHSAGLVKLLHCRVLVLATTFALAALTLQAQTPRPDQLREEAGQLERRAQELRESGRVEAAEATLNEARALRERAERALGPRAELQRERRRLMAELRELRAAGREGEAAEVKERIVELERHLEEMEIRSENQRGPRPPMAERLRPGMPEVEARMHHLELAIENLRLAGLPQIADRLTGELERMREDAARRGRFQPEMPPGMVPEEALRQVRAELEEVRQQLGQMREQLEELSRQSR